MRAVVGFVLVAIAVLYRLDAPALWNDEANTAQFARGVLRSGVPDAFDGRNLVLYANCLELSENLLSRRIPWLQAYAGAASIALFGDDTAGVRTLFALLAALSYWPLYALLRGRLPHAWLWSAFLLASPQLLLLERQARYYALATVLFVVIGRLALAGVSRRLPWLGLSLVVLWQLHPLIGASAALSLVLFAAFYERSALGASLGLGLAAALSWAIPYALVLRPAAEHWAVSEALIAWRAGVGPWFFGQSLLAALLDLDYVNALPLLGALAVAALIVRRRVPVFSDRLFGYCVIVCIAGVLTASAAVGCENLACYAPLRMMPQAALFAPLALVLALNATGRAGAWLAALLLVVNGGTLWLWFPYFARPPLPLSWWLPVYGEILSPPPDPWLAVRDFLQARALPPGDEVLRVVPAYSSDTLRFYLGARYIVDPNLAPGTRCEALVRARAGEAAYGRLRRTPLWEAVFGGRDSPAQGYREAARFAGVRPFADATRPELTRHFFARDQAPAIVLYRRAQ